MKPDDKSPPEQTLPPAAVAGAVTQIDPVLLREELDIVKQRLEAIHPDPYARISVGEFETHFSQVKQSLNYPLSRAEFFIKLAPLLASLRDVHSFINLPKDHFGNLSQRDEKLFPVAVILHQNALYVAADLSDSPRLPAGAQLTAINHAPVDYLLTVMREVTARETQSGQDRRIQLDFAWLLAAMGYSSQEYQVSYLWQGKSYDIELEGLQVSPPRKTASGDIISYYGYSRLNPDTGLLWLNDFNETPEKFASFLDDKFTQMREQGVSNLIIDVRYNQGGLSQNLKNLLSRITEEPVSWANHGVIKVSKPLKDNHFNKTRERRESKYDWGLQWVPLEWTDSLQHSIWWAEPGELIELDMESIEPQGGQRPSNIWVLTNGYCYSACSFFVASVNYYGLARTLGEETGSLARFQFAYPVQLELPHSGLYYTLPTMRLDFRQGEENQLISPQLPIERSLQDITLRRDPVLLKALEEAALIKVPARVMNSSESTK